MSLSQDMNEVKEQKKMYNALESNSTSLDCQEGDGRPSSDLTNINYFEEVNVNPVSAVAEQVCNFPECVDTSSTKKHDDYAEVDVISPRAMDSTAYKRKKQVKICHRKRTKASNSLGNSLKSIEEGAGSSVLVVENKMVDTYLDHSDEELAPVNLVNTSERDVAAGHGTSLQAVQDSSIEKVLSGCSVGELALKESKKRVQMETLKQTIKEDGFVKNDSVVGLLETNFEQANSVKINVIEDAAQDVYSAEENIHGSSSFKEDKALVGASGNDLFHEHLDRNTLDTQSKMGDAISSSSKLGAIKDAPSLVINQEGLTLQVVQSSPERALTGCSRRKLLILDVNGLLADIVQYVSYGYQADTIIAHKPVFKRPFCDDFLQFCFERFNVGVWSSRTKRNMQLVIEFLMGKTKDNLLFCWDRSHCTETGYNTVENRDKPLILKELKKLWEKHDPNLPWERGEYNESNTLLLDDSPYKALCNPPNTAIFPYSYRYKDVKDNSLGPGGDLRVYLEGLALVENVQKYVEQNPFGQRPITEKNLSWAFYLKVIQTVLSQTEDDANCSSTCQ